MMCLGESGMLWLLRCDITEWQKFWRPVLKLCETIQDPMEEMRLSNMKHLLFQFPYNERNVKL